MTYMYVPIDTLTYIGERDWGNLELQPEINSSVHIQSKMMKIAYVMYVTKKPELLIHVIKTK